MSVDDRESYLQTGHDARNTAGAGETHQSVCEGSGASGRKPLPTTAGAAPDRDEPDRAREEGSKSADPGHNL